MVKALQETSVAVGSEFKMTSRQEIAKAWIAWLQQLTAFFQEASQAAALLAAAMTSFTTEEAESALRTFLDLERSFLAHAQEGEVLQRTSQKVFLLETSASPLTYVELLASGDREERHFAKMLAAQLRAAEKAVREFSRARAHLQGVAEAGLREAKIVQALIESGVFGGATFSFSSFRGEAKIPPRVFDGRA